jgi:hypothetical protein
MVFSLFAYFFSMVTSFAAIMIILIGLADSQMRTAPLPRYPDYPVLASAEATATPPHPTIVEQDKPEQAQKVEQALKTAQAREDVKKIARAKLARERKRVALAQLRQQRQQREDRLAFGYAGQPFNSPTFSPFGQRTEY